MKTCQKERSEVQDLIEGHDWVWKQKRLPRSSRDDFRDSLIYAYRRGCRDGWLGCWEEKEQPEFSFDELGRTPSLPKPGVVPAAGG